LTSSLVERRQQIILKRATQTTAIVSSLFPKNVRERLFSGDDHMSIGTKNRLKGFLTGSPEEKENADTAIADIYAHCTGKQY
jgi:hypothetical protein